MRVCRCGYVIGHEDDDPSISLCYTVECRLLVKYAFLGLLEVVALPL
jgi:hypothetical protein